MPRFCANVGFLYPKLSLAEGIAAAAAAGFRAVECANPYAGDPSELKAALDRHGLSQVLINAPRGAGGQSYMADPDRGADFAAAVAEIRRYCVALRCGRVNMLAGTPPPGLDPARAFATYVENLRRAARTLAPDGVMLTVEHINAFDSPGALVDTPTKAFAVVAEVDRDNVRVQYDVYHAQRSEGNIFATLRAHIGTIGHIQISDTPGRTAPGSGELAYANILREIDALGYGGWIGLEYRPASDAAPSYDWIEAYGFSRA